MTSSATPTLLGIPPELRLIIYKYLLVAEAHKLSTAPFHSVPNNLSAPIRISSTIQLYPQSDPSAYNGTYSTFENMTRDANRKAFAYQELPDTAILFTCRKLYHEASPTLYGENDFLFSTNQFFDMESMMKSLNAWTSNIGAIHTGQLRKITFQLPPILFVTKENEEPRVNALQLVDFMWQNPRCNVQFTMPSGIGVIRRSYPTRNYGRLYEFNHIRRPSESNNMMEMVRAILQSELLKKYHRQKMMEGLWIRYEEGPGKAVIVKPDPVRRVELVFVKTPAGVLVFPERPETEDLFEVP
jgi:hypothetical protein